MIPNLFNRSQILADLEDQWDKEETDDNSPVEIIINIETMSGNKKLTKKHISVGTGVVIEHGS